MTSKPIELPTNKEPSNMSKETITLDIVVAMEIQEVGFYTYPELIKLFKDIFTNNASKEQIDYADSITKSSHIKRALAKAYDNVQQWIEENK